MILTIIVIGFIVFLIALWRLSNKNHPAETMREDIHREIHESKEVHELEDVHELEGVRELEETDHMDAQTITVLLDPQKMENPDLDIRYRIPAVIESVTEHRIWDGGYDYVSGGSDGREDIIAVYLHTEEGIKAAAELYGIFRSQKFLENDLSECADLFYSGNSSNELASSKKIVTRDGYLWNVCDLKMVDFLICLLNNVSADIPFLVLSEELRKFYVSRIDGIVKQAQAYRSKGHHNTANALTICLESEASEKIKSLMGESSCIYTTIQTCGILIGQCICDEFEKEYPTELFEQDAEELVESLYSSYESYQEKYRGSKRKLKDILQAYFQESIVGWDEFEFNEPYAGDMPESVNGIRLPADYIGFMREHNGGEGDVGSSWLCLDRVETLWIENKEMIGVDEGVKEVLKGKLIIGSSGSEELLGVDQEGRYFIVPITTEEKHVSILGDRMENLPEDIKKYRDSKK